jgi:pimeloyl-ACP methyl ester carboxylesterase
MRSFEHDGIRLAYDVVGEGLPVVLHLGAAGDSRAWREAGYVAGLSDFRVVLLDHRGHGQSEAPTDPLRHTVADCVGDVIALADELGLDRFAFWGHSYGAAPWASSSPRHTPDVSLRSLRPAGSTAR